MLRAVRVEPKVPCEVAQGVLRAHPEAVHSCLGHGQVPLASVKPWFPLTVCNRATILYSFVHVSRWTLYVWPLLILFPGSSPVSTP